VKDDDDVLGLFVSFRGWSCFLISRFGHGAASDEQRQNGGASVPLIDRNKYNTSYLKIVFVDIRMLNTK
jgi:hypothetical protein